MKQIKLEVTKRTIKGKKVKHLRAKGALPANVFGKNVQSLEVEVKTDTFKKVYDAAGETGLIELTVGGEKRPVLIQNVQMHPVTGKILHVDFRQVDLKEKVKAQVPIELIGESPVVADNAGVVLQLLNEVEVEALPAELPEHIEVDVTKLVQVGDTVKVSDLRLSGELEILENPESEVVKIGELVVEEPEPVTEPAAEGEEVAETPAEGEETKPEEAKESGEGTDKKEASDKKE